MAVRLRATGVRAPTGDRMRRARVDWRSEAPCAWRGDGCAGFAAARPGRRVLLLVAGVRMACVAGSKYHARLKVLLPKTYYPNDYGERSRRGGCGATGLGRAARRAPVGAARAPRQRQRAAARGQLTDLWRHTAARPQPTSHGIRSARSVN